jgi:hypothetical protein
MFFQRLNRFTGRARYSSAVSPPIVTQIATVAAALDPVQPDPLAINGDGVPCKPTAPRIIFHSVRHHSYINASGTNVRGPARFPAHSTDAVVMGPCDRQVTV